MNPDRRHPNGLRVSNQAGKNIRDVKPLRQHQSQTVSNVRAQRSTGASQNRTKQDFIIL